MRVSTLLTEDDAREGTLFRTVSMSPPTSEQPTAQASSPTALRRELGVFGATMMGLGAMVGTGVFVGLPIAAGVAGPWVLVAIVLAAGLATCNALSSAQLAARHPVSGGTYEYGYLRLNPWAGFTAGWMFLFAKSCSAATAGLGVGQFVVQVLWPSASWEILVAGVGVVVVMTMLVLSGIRRSNIANIVIVGVTLLTLVVFVVAALPSWPRWSNTVWRIDAMGHERAVPVTFFDVMYATGLTFVAFTGYGRIATLGEEVKEPARTIPKAIVTTVTVVALLYIAVAWTVVAWAHVAPSVQRWTLTDFAAIWQFKSNAGMFGVMRVVLILGGITAMLGVLLNLILGLSRVLLAMGRRGDMPRVLAKVDEKHATPGPAVIVTGCTIGGLVLIGDVKLTWSLSAFTVLIYYAITNLAALRLSGDERLYPRFVSWLGLGGCVFVACFVPWHVWLIGLGVIGVGMLWRGWMQRSGSGTPRADIEH